MKYRWILMAIFVLTACQSQRQEEEIVTTTTTPVTTIPTSVLTEESTTEATTVSSTVTTTTGAFASLQSYIRDLNVSDVVVSYYNSSNMIYKSLELQDIMYSSFKKSMASIVETDECNLKPVMKLVYPNGTVYIARYNNTYYAGKEETVYNAVFSDADFWSRLAAYDKNTFMNILDSKGKEVYTIDDYFFDVPYDTTKETYTIAVENKELPYAMTSYYDFSNELYYTSFFDTKTFEMNTIKYDYKEQIGYYNSCIYEISGIAYSSCTDREITMLKKHIGRFLNDGQRYLSPVAFYKEIGYENLTLQSEYEDILYSQYEESLYTERILNMELKDEYQYTETEGDIRSLFDDISESQYIVRANVTAKNPTFDYGEKYLGEFNSIIYSSYTVHIVEAIKGDISEDITVIYPGGLLEDTFTNASIYQEMSMDGEYILMLNPKDDVYEIHNILSGDNMMHFLDSKLMIWSEMAPKNTFKGMAGEAKIIEYIKEVIDYLEEN